MQGKAQAQQLELKNLVLHNVSGQIQLSYGVEIQDVQALHDYLDQGMVLQLRSKVKLVRNRRWWRDSLLGQEEMVFELKSRPLQGEYVLTKQGSSDSQRDKDLSRLLSRHWSGLKVRLGNWSELSPDTDYAVELLLSLKRSDVPLWLKKSLFFWSWDLAPERKFKMDFTY